MIYPLRRLWEIKAQWMQAAQLSASTRVSASDVLTFVWFLLFFREEEPQALSAPVPWKITYSRAIQFILIHCLIPPLDPQAQALRIKSERDSEKWDKGCKMTKNKEWRLCFWLFPGSVGLTARRVGHRSDRTPPMSPACSGLSERWAAPTLGPHGRKWWVLSPERRAFWL